MKKNQKNKSKRSKWVIKYINKILVNIIHV